jgi:hypothetical protein
MIVRHSPGAQRITVAATRPSIRPTSFADMRAFNLTPHIAQNATRRRSAIDGRTTHHSGYEISQQKRKRVETVRLGQDHRRAGPANCFYGTVTLIGNLQTK